MIFTNTLLLAQTLLGALAGALGAGTVDLLGPLCAGYQQDDIVRHDLGKAVADDHLVPDTLGVKPDCTRTKCDYAR